MTVIGDDARPTVNIGGSLLLPKVYTRTLPL